MQQFHVPRAPSTSTSRYSLGSSRFQNFGRRVTWVLCPELRLLLSHRKSRRAFVIDSTDHGPQAERLYTGAIEGGPALPDQTVPIATWSTRGQPGPTSVITTSLPLLADYSPAMSYLAPSTSSLQTAERIGQGTTNGEAQPPRFASFSCYTYWPVN